MFSSCSSQPLAILELENIVQYGKKAREVISRTPSLIADTFGSHLHYYMLPLLLICFSRQSFMALFLQTNLRFGFGLLLLFGGFIMD